VEAIAIIGMSCRFPGSENVHAFWRLLREGIDAVSEVPAERWDVAAFFDQERDAPGKMTTRWGGFLPRVDLFDAAFFGISPREANRMDPQQRLLLETAWEALEDAGQAREQLSGRAIGVFIGISTNDYGMSQFANTAQIDAYCNTGNSLSIAANRISYTFDFRGPSVAVDSACSSSLLAVHLACQSLRTGDSEMALAGGVNVILSPAPVIGFSKLGAMSRDGHCKTFDASADGYVRGEGVGMVMLKPLAHAVRDRDPIYAVIRGTAVNNDGRSNGLTAPSLQAQVAVLRSAYEQANIDPRRVGYVEAHGTGTLLGDTIEARALGKVLGAGRVATQPLAIGSVKTNLGHLEAAAGIAGLIKVALALKHRAIPPSLHFKELNPLILRENLALRVQTSFEPFPRHNYPLVAGVSSFGFGGTNVHAVLEEAQSLPEAERDLHASKSAFLLPLSAATEQALHQLVQKYREWLTAPDTDFPPLVDICGCASTRRSHQIYRVSFAASSQGQLVDQFGAFLNGEECPGVSRGRQPPNRREKLTFVFSGQGSQWLGMACELLEQEPIFAKALRACDSAVAPYAGWSLVDELYKPKSSSNLDEIGIVQPVLFAIQVALAALWRSWGIVPDKVIGHSMGEVAAAHVSGSISLEDAARIICVRSCLLSEISGLGTMATVELTPSDAESTLCEYRDKLALAAINGPSSTVLSGDRETLQELISKLESKGVFCRMVNANVAAHSSQVDRLCDKLIGALDGLETRTSKIMMYSTVTGGLVDGHSLNADYWAKNLRNTVRFKSAVDLVLREGQSTFVEVSPHPILLAAITQCAGNWPQQITILPSLHRVEGRIAMLSTLGSLYTKGYSINWRAVSSCAAKCATLPSYPWQHESFWFAPEVSQIDDRKYDVRVQPDHDERSGFVRDYKQSVYELVWRATKRSGPCGDAKSGTNRCRQDWIVFADQVVGRAIAAYLIRHGDTCITVFSGTDYRQVDEQSYEIDPACAESFRKLFADLESRGISHLDGVVHLWSLLADSPPDEVGSSDQALTLSCFSALWLVQSLAKWAAGRRPPRVWLVTKGVHAVYRGAEATTVFQAPLWGLGRTVWHEYPEFRCTLIDLSARQTPNEIEALLNELRCDGNENQIALRDEDYFVARLVRVPLRARFASSSVPRDERQTTNAQPTGKIIGGLADSNGGPPSVGAGPTLLQRNGVYLVTGGTGNLGLAVAQWMARKGARHIALVARTPPSIEAQSGIEAMQVAGAEVLMVLGDIARANDVVKIFAQIDNTNLPLRGIVHAAGIVDDGTIAQLTISKMRAVMAPKIAGAWELHRQTMNRSLDFLVLFSSAASLLGSPGLGNYAAANAFLDGLAHYRHSRGLPAISIDWGPWAGSVQAARYRAARGHELYLAPTISQGEALDLLDDLLSANFPQVGVLPFDWPQWNQVGLSENLPPLLAELITRKPALAVNETAVKSSTSLLDAVTAEIKSGRTGLVEGHLRNWLAQVLRLPTSRIEADDRLTDLGIDSLMAIELRKKVWTELGITIDLATLLRGPTLRELGTKLIAQIASNSTEQAFASSLSRGAHQELLDRLKDEQPDTLEGLIHEFSEDTVDALLKELKVTGEDNG
jgi:acyl transferase domain-containing protein